MESERKLENWLYVNKFGQIELDRQKLYKHIKSQHIFYVTDKNCLFKYSEGYYQPLSRKQTYNIIKGYIPTEIRDKGDWVAIAEEFYTDSPDIKESDFNQDENIVVFNNGVLHLDTGQLLKHSPKYLVTRKVNGNYLPEAALDDAPVFSNFIHHLSQDGDEQFTVVSLVLEFIGAVLSCVKGWRFKKMLLLIGPGNTGKSKLRELVMNLIGLENCVSIDLKKINERFGTGALHGKRLAGSGDMSYMAIEEMDTVKQLTGGDTLMAEFKGKDIFSFIYDGFLLCNANQLPYFRGDRGIHVYERFLIVICNNVIPKEKRDPLLLDKLLMEKDIIASVSMRYLRDAIQRGYIFSESDSMKSAREEYIVNNNSLLAFVKEGCEIGQGTILRSQFNRMYKIWCKINNVQPERNKDIEPQLNEHLGIQSKKTGGCFKYSLCLTEEMFEVLNSATEDIKQGLR